MVPKLRGVHPLFPFFVEQLQWTRNTLLVWVHLDTSDYVGGRKFQSLLEASGSIKEGHRLV
jgi:hypothetical protein